MEGQRFLTGACASRWRLVSFMIQNSILGNTDSADQFPESSLVSRSRAKGDSTNPICEIPSKIPRFPNEDHPPQRDPRETHKKNFIVSHQALTRRIHVTPRLYIIGGVFGARTRRGHPEITRMKYTGGCQLQASHWYREHSIRTESKESPSADVAGNTVEESREGNEEIEWKCWEWVVVWWDWRIRPRRTSTNECKRCIQRQRMQGAQRTSLRIPESLWRKSRR
jgi:hypothetical protein